MPDSLAGAFMAHPDSKGELYRPLAMLTFALNYYWGQDNVFGYHALNLLFHILTAWILFALIFNLYKSPVLKHNQRETAFFISLLATVLWALNPIQTQTVIYIVQRMAVMTTMFYLSALLCYIKARLSDQDKTRFLYFSASCLCFLAALGSKENAITLPLVIIVFEFIFFQNNISSGTMKRYMLLALFAGVIIFAAAVTLFLQGDLLQIFKGYNNRFFSLSERLLTEPRIVLYYLSQIFYPIPNRLSISHDIQIYSSLLEPWTTLPAITIILLLIGLGFYLIRRQPVISLAILFYFLAHSVESTFIGLELFFEHRNYLPSAFLFWPVALGVHKALCFYKTSNRLMFSFLTATVILIMVSFGIGTYIRNITWLTEKSLWEDAMLKSPAADRPLHSLAVSHYQRKGDYRTALGLLKKALELQSQAIAEHSLIYSNIASIYARWNSYDNAVYYWDKALEVQKTAWL